MANNQQEQGGKQASTYVELLEHAEISSVHGKKVFIVDSAGNQVSDFGAKYNTSDIDEATSTITYIGKMDGDGAWMVMKIDTGSGSSFLYATLKNNSSYDNYSSAWTDRSSLTYNLYNIAF